MKKIDITLKEKVQALSDAPRALPEMALLLLRAQPWYVLALVAIQGLQGLVPLSTAWIAKGIFDLLAHVLQQKQGAAHAFPLLLLLLGAQFGILLLSQILAAPSQYFQNRLNLRLSMVIKTRMYQKIAGFVGLAYFEDPTFHDTIQVVTNNAQIGPQQLLSTLTTLFESLVTLGSFLSILLAFQPVMALIIFVAVLPQLYAQLRFSGQRFQLILTNTIKERLATYYGQVLTWVHFAKEVRLFDLGSYFLRKYVQSVEETNQAQVTQQQRELHWNLLLATLGALVSGGMSFFVTLQTFFGRLSLGDMALYISAVASLQTALLGMILALTNLPESVRFFRQYTSLLALPQPLSISSVPQPVKALCTGIELRNISFRYSEQHPWILRHVNLFLPAKQCLALVGLNGAGKTTLVKLLMRLYDPTEGEILWDGIDVREFDPQELRRYMGAIFQDFSRYDLSVQENIGLGDVEHVEDVGIVQQAAIKAGIHGRIESFPQGYQSILSRWLDQKNEGVDFSGGEWQKVALARMFMRDSEVLILDEPTASLDAEAEYALYQHFKELMQGHTCLLITHRFSTVRMADCIAVLKDGRISEHGTHPELIARQGTYAKLYAMQAKTYTET